MAAAAELYFVRIHYREPTYERYAGRKRDPYRWTYEVRADNAEQAKALALEQFEDIARRSSVGWRRQILLVEMEGGGDN